MASSDKTVAEAAKTLQRSESDVKKACAEHLHKNDVVMLSAAEIEQLQVYFGEHSRGAAVKTTPPPERKPTTRTKGSKVNVIARKVRGRAAQQANAGTVAPTAPATSVPPPPPPAPATVTTKTTTQIGVSDTATATDALEQRRKEQAEQEAAQAAAAAAASAAAKEAPRTGPVPTRTITITAKDLREREKKKRTKRKKPTTQITKEKFEKPVEPKKLSIDIPEEISIKELAYQMAVKTSEVVSKLTELEFIGADVAEMPEMIPQDEAHFVVEALGHTPRKVYRNKASGYIKDLSEKTGTDLLPRPPVVTVMGHVDHGKTSLLDYIRKAKVAASEAGGITQHIGAYQVEVGTDKITFIDTPGHEVFTEMRARGANVTDIVILVVAADDGVQPQTREAIDHARSAEVPIVVAINKMDLAGADPDNVKQQLGGLGLQPEDWGGDVIMLPVSAQTGEGIDKLLESILLTAEILELKAAQDVDARGSIIEAKTEKGLGVVVSLIVKAGVLRKGDFVLCESQYGRVRAMRDEKGNLLTEALPATPVQIQGIPELPKVGVEFFVAKDEKSAREHAQERSYIDRQRELARKTEILEANDLDELLAMVDARNESKILNLIVKADVAGTAEAMETALGKIGSDDASLKVIHAGVGAISESDVLLAQASDAMLVGFRVVANPKARRMIADRKIDAFFSEVFYEVTDFLRDRLLGMLDPIQEEKILGTALVKEVFHINKVGKVAGCAVEEGSITKQQPVRIVRDGTVVFKTEIKELRHYKDIVNQVASGSDCGIFLNKYTDFKPGDRIESYEVTVTARTL